MTLRKYDPVGKDYIYIFLHQAGIIAHVYVP